MDGVDKLPDATTKQKEWKYEKTHDTQVSIPDSDPDQVPKQSATLTNVGISIGVKYKFGSTK